MISPSDCFKFSDRELNCDQIVWKVSGELPYFNGHFPNRPILPAVAFIDFSLQWIKAKRPAATLSLSCLKRAKFLRPITPGQLLTSKLKGLKDDCHEVQFFSEGELVATVIFKTINH